MTRKTRVAFLIGDYPPQEHKRRADVALSYSTSEIEVGLVQVSTTAYNRGNSPAELQLVAPAFIDAFRRAEAEGYDAAVPLGTLDLEFDKDDNPWVGVMYQSAIAKFDKKTGKPKLRMGNRSVPKELYELSKVFFG